MHNIGANGDRAHLTYMGKYSAIANVWDDSCVHRLEASITIPSVSKWIHLCKSPLPRLLKFQGNDGMEAKLACINLRMMYNYMVAYQHYLSPYTRHFHA